MVLGCGYGLGDVIALFRIIERFIVFDRDAENVLNFQCVGIHFISIFRKIVISKAQVFV